MSERSAIEWTDATWNPTRGCDKVSAGCKNCYAETFSERWRGINGHPFEQGFDLRLVPEALAKPLTWKKPRRIFVNSMSDLFHEDIPNEYIAAVFGVMAACPQHTFQILTKRAARLPEWFAWIAARDEQGRALFPDDPVDWRIRQLLMVTARRKDADVGANHGGPWPLPNVHLGVSTENQETADERIPYLLRTPAVVKFVSAEPLLGPIDLFGRDEDGGFGQGWSLTSVKTLTDYGAGVEYDVDAQIGVDWVIVGGESGPGARAMDIAWARSIVEQCKAADVACFVKQLGAKPWDSEVASRAIGGGKIISQGNDHLRRLFSLVLESRKGGDMAEWPEDLRVRQFPTPGGEP